MSHQNFIQSLYQKLELEKREVDLILCHFLRVNTAGLMIYNKKISDSLEQDISAALKKRAQGMPLAYITGEKGFWSLNLLVNQHTLIPRPETEQIVELVLKWTDSAFSGSILDLGTGSGAIALSLAKDRPKANVLAVDFSSECVKIAEANRNRYHLNNIKILQSNWFKSITADYKFDFILSNPPYVAEDDPHLEHLSFEPISALTAENNGLADLQKIISQARKYLKPDATLILEHGYNQQDDVSNLFQKYGYTGIKTYNDLSDIPRISLALYD